MWRRAILQWTMPRSQGTCVNLLRCSTCAKIKVGLKNIGRDTSVIDVHRPTVPRFAWRGHVGGIRWQLQCLGATRKCHMTYFQTQSCQSVVHTAYLNSAGNEGHSKAVGTERFHLRLCTASWCCPKLSTRNGQLCHEIVWTSFLCTR